MAVSLGAEAFRSVPEASTRRDDEREFAQIDELVEKIFDVYSFGAIYDRGRTPGSEKEFLSRLGLGLTVREPDALYFPEQLKSWALARLKPFDDSYFLPVYGLRFGEIYAWIDKLIAILETRLNQWVNDMVAITRDLKPIQEGFVDGNLSAEECRNRAAQLRIGERLESTGRNGDTLHAFLDVELQQGMPHTSLVGLMKLFGIKPGEVRPDFVFPHHVNPLEQKLFVILPNGSHYFLDPASAHRIVAKTFEQCLLNDSKLQGRYYKNRSRAMENLVAENIRKVFPKAAIHRNYYLEKGRLEKDFFILHGRTVILIECKTSRVRGFRGATDDLDKYKSDFEESVQYGYDQAHEVKRRVLENGETTFLEGDGKPKLSIRRAEVDRIFIICVSTVPRGPFGTDLSYELKKNDCEPFPLALGLFDFETICKYFDSDQFVQYLNARELLHGKTVTGDELNYAGYFLKFGHLNLAGTTMLTDDFSGIFDRRWYRERGLEVEEPTGGPVFTSMTRKGNRLNFEYGTSKRQTIRLPDWVIERTVGKSPIKMKGSDRNRPCPCGSGIKLKHCCGVN